MNKNPLMEHPSTVDSLSAVDCQPAVGMADDPQAILEVIQSNCERTPTSPVEN